ncbi:hypothetical protein DU508_03670 [Pedobacter chinensis]|uniref:Uncharacterized protein n=1 Tax=Pedobacter chinensis TaxID=2282421 RepID=A0A369Q3L0_9SPHI|nr:hypothetical protein DU508_03670 [Pedobacter chinensis]
MSAKPCQLVWQFFEFFCKQGKLLFDKGLNVLEIFCEGVLPTFANWHIWAKEKAVRFGYCF